METETLLPVNSETPANAIDAGSEVIAKHRKPRSDAGKPRGSYKKKDLQGSVDPVPVSENTQSALVALDAGAIKKGVASLCKAVDAMLVRKTYRASLQITKDDNFSKNLATDVSMVEEERDLISELTATVCVRHEILGRYAPEALLVIAIGSYTTRVITAFRKLNDIEEQLRKANANKS